MSSDDKIVSALRALAEHDRALEAPVQVEARLAERFRSHRSKRVWRRAVPLAAAAAAAAAAVILAIMLTNRPPQPAPIQAITPQRVETPVPSVVAAVPSVPRKITRKAVGVPAPSREVVTEFFPLMDVAPPFGRGELLRMRVPAAVMQQVGLPVHEDHFADSVEADILVGEEGLPRAIRFVSFEAR